jgi:hypothetical protein
MSPSFKSLASLLVIAIFVVGCRAQCEDETSDKFQVGKKPGFIRNCSQIRRKHGKLCNYNANVRAKCQKSCAICGELGNDDFCKDVTGKFTIAKGTQWEKQRSCASAANNPTKFCSKFNFKKKCPVACGLCTPKYKKCNGLESSCYMRANELLYASIHNANHHEDPFPSHQAELEGAINAGYRGLFMDICKCNGQVTFCHGDCSYGRRDPIAVFKWINEFLDYNPRDLIIFNFEFSTGDPLPSELWNVMSQVSGFTSKVYQKSGQWPTLKTILDSQKQIIVFQHNAPYEASPPPLIYDFFAYAMGTNWSFNSVSKLSDSEDSCSIRRGPNGSADFYSVNTWVTNFLGLPSPSSATTVNEYSYLKQRIADCASVMNSWPNFVTIDFWQRGDLVKVTLEENAWRSWQ